MSTAEIAFVLDVSALLRHARLEGVAAGEMIQVVGEDNGIAGVPAQCFLTAYAKLDNAARGRLVSLINTPDANVAVLPLLGEDVVEIARSPAVIADDVGGHAIVEARRRGVLLATYAGKAARTALDEDQVLELVEPGDA